MSSSAPTLLMMLPPCLVRAAKRESPVRETMQQETMAPKKAEKNGFHDAGDCKKSDSSEFKGKRDLLVVKYFLSWLKEKALRRCQPFY